MGVEFVIGMESKDIGLVWLLEIGDIECAFIHIEISLFLFKFRV